MPSTAGSKLLEYHQPAFDATAVKKLKESSAIIVGKTNLDEFGMGNTTEGSAYQVTANPWNLECVPGGSSGGSVADVSARQCVVSLGSDTGGAKPDVWPCVTIWAGGVCIIARCYWLLWLIGC
ncbi:putative glutaminyl-tRNA synthase (glutamine-hydrolyzing) [Helianthus annuus]|nr:putative glutaminyl-tRNA synthase (glutamine-hydrolyzing) [Helianthus annuus]